MIQYQDILRDTKPFLSVLDDKRKGMLSHCYMLLSEDKLACQSLCKMIARAILCPNDGCSACNVCLRVDSGNYGDLVVLDESKADDVKEFLDEAYLSPSENQRKVMYIPFVEDIDRRNQNFLLKTLEEPNENVIFVLGVTRPSAVLETVKSRAQKLYLENIADEALRNALQEDGYNSTEIERAVACSFGSLTKAENLVNDNNFVTNYTIWIEILRDMLSSRQVAEMMTKLDCKNADTISEYLDILEIIIKAMLDYHTQTNVKAFDELEDLSKGFNSAMLSNISDAIIESRKKLESHCKPETIVEVLLMTILEVKYKCR
ncbi:MAG: hypothetical protein RSB10_05895 [Clostridia bacterium]